MANLDRFHIVFQVGYQSITSLIDDTISATRVFTDKKFGKNASENKKTIKRLQSRKYRIKGTVRRELDKISGVIMENVLERYLNYPKLDGSPVGRTGALESALSQKGPNVYIEANNDFATLHLMSMDFLANETPPDGEEAIWPYYLYQMIARPPGRGGPRMDRSYITRAEAIRNSDNEILLEDLNIFQESMLNLANKIADPRRLR